MSMIFHQVLLLFAASTMASVNSCEFGNDVIQSIYDNFELFRKTKAFDPTNPTVPLQQYHYYDTDGIKRLAIKIDGDYMVEYYKKNDKNEIETKNGQYDVKNIEEDYKKVLADLNQMRKKMFDFQDGLSKEDFERVQLFELYPLKDGGFYVQYIENGVGSLSVSKDGVGSISGTFSCGGKDQKYNVDNGKVAVDGEPYIPFYN